MTLDCFMPSLVKTSCKSVTLQSWWAKGFQPGRNWHKYPHFQYYSPYCSSFEQTWISFLLILAQLVWSRKVIKFHFPLSCYHLTREKKKRIPFIHVWANFTKECSAYARLVEIGWLGSQEEDKFARSQHTTQVS